MLYSSNISGMGYMGKGYGYIQSECVLTPQHYTKNTTASYKRKLGIEFMERENTSVMSEVFIDMCHLCHNFVFHDWA